MAISRWLSTVSSLVITAFFATGGALAQNAGKIGVASAVKNRVEGSTGGAARALAAGSSIFAREVVRTGDESMAQLLFLDETSLSIGPQSEVTLDRFVFDPSRGAGNVVISATRGAFRFVSGSQQPSNYQIRTPVATIGVRGTIVDNYVNTNAKGETVLIVILVEGSCVITLGGKPYSLSKPGHALIATSDGKVQLVNWGSALFFAVDRKWPFPLFGSQFVPTDPSWTHIPDLPQDRIEQLIGGGPPYVPEGNNCTGN